MENIYRNINLDTFMADRDAFIFSMGWQSEDREALYHEAMKLGGICRAYIESWLYDVE